MCSSGKWSLVLLGLALGGGVAGRAPAVGGALPAAPAAALESVGLTVGPQGEQGVRSLPDAWFLPDEPLLGFVEIPAGPFVMGADLARDDLAYDNERWAAADSDRQVVVDAYFIGRYEVTVAQFGAFVEATGFTVHPAALQGPPDHPVTQVTWPDALAYAAWLETTLAAWPETPQPLARALRDGWRVSLPSEAEWEKAARGTDGRIYPWGNVPRLDRANYGAAGTTPVGSIPCPECPFGLRDMSGNVWELTRSPHQPYPYDEADDLDDLDAEALWVMRGGSFSDTEQNIRTTVRGVVEPGVRRHFIGFRLVISRFSMSAPGHAVAAGLPISSCRSPPAAPEPPRLTG